MNKSISSNHCVKLLQTPWSECVSDISINDSQKYLQQVWLNQTNNMKKLGPGKGSTIEVQMRKVWLYSMWVTLSEYNTIHTSCFRLKKKIPTCLFLFLLLFLVELFHPDSVLFIFFLLSSFYFLFCQRLKHRPLVNRWEKFRQNRMNKYSS